MPYSTNLIRSPRYPSFLASLSDRAPNNELIILGNFNLHHPMWYPPRRNAQYKDKSDKLLALFAEHSATLQSQPHVPTFRNTRDHQSTINLVFTTPGARDIYVQRETAENSNYDLGSDHAPILHTIVADIPPQAPRTRCRYNKAEWDEARTTLSELMKAK